MAAASRPVVLKWVFGKGLVKRRRESDDTSRFIAEQVTINYAEDTFKDSVSRLRTIITQEVRAELDHLHRQFDRFILGAPDSQRRPRGRVTALTQGAGKTPSFNLGSAIPRWEPRSQKYLRRKRSKGNYGWFSNEGYLKARMGSYPKGVNGETLFEEIFGPVSVTIKRNLKMWGKSKGSMTTGVLTQSSGSRGGMSQRLGDLLGEPMADAMAAQYGRPGGGNRTQVQMQLATVEVRALGKLNPGAINRNSLYGPGGSVSQWDQEVANRLGGRANKYRPSLEPFLDFFFERALGHAVNERLRRGGVTSSLTRRSKRG